MEIKVLRLPHAKSLDLPAYQTTLSAGLDLCAAIENPIFMEKGQIQLIPTGFAFHIPVGYEGQVRPRSGLALQHGITLVNSPGTIDADYRGEIKVPLINLGQDVYQVTPGQRIAQLIIAPVIQAKLRETDSLSETNRGTGGFGHTGSF